jgi:hypothetical protein
MLGAAAEGAAPTRLTVQGLSARRTHGQIGSSAPLARGAGACEATRTVVRPTHSMGTWALKVRPPRR